MVNNLSSTDAPTATHIQNTPFTLVGNKKHGYFIGYGHAQITAIYPNKREALRALEYNHWEIICNMMAYTIEHWSKLKDQALNHDTKNQPSLFTNDNN